MKSRSKNSLQWYFLTANAALILFLIFFTAPIPGNADVVFNWAKQIEGSDSKYSTSLAYDSNGNVYTTGYFAGTVDFDPGVGVSNLISTSGGNDVFISKLDSSGNFVWAKKIGGTSLDYANSVTVDSSGNVYTTGYFQNTVDFNPGVGTFDLTSAGSNDIFISKLDSAGDFVWAKNMGGASTDIGYSIFVDSSSNVYTTGYFLSTADFDPGAGTQNLTSAGGHDIFISKLDINGDFVWVKQIGGTASDISNSITIDSNSYIYTSGYFNNTVDFNPGVGTFDLTSAGSNDIFISKLDSAGDFVWAKNMGGVGVDSSSSIIVDLSGNVYSTGSFESTADFDPGAGTSNLTSAGSNDIFISKLDSAGDFVWAKQIGGTTSDMGNAIALDSSNNVYITGYFIDTADFDPGAGTSNLTSAGLEDIFISKLDSNGDFVWVKQIGGGGEDKGSSVKIDSSNNVYTTGIFSDFIDLDPGAGVTFLDASGVTNIFILKLTPDTTAPTISELTGVGVVVNNGTISYTFTTNEAGTITYGGSCSSATTVATVGSNTITLTPLPAGNYTNCTITVTDASSNASTPLSISSFDIVVHSGGGGSTSTPTESTPTPETPTPTVPVTPQPEIVTPIIPTEPITPPVICNQGELYNANTGEACTSFLPVLVEPISEPEIIVTPKPIVKPKEIITEIKTEELPTTSTEVTIPTTSIPENTNTQSNTEPTLEEKYPDIPIPVREEETNSESILEYINRQARESFKETINIANQGKEKIKEILETKEGNITSKAVTIGGIVAGTSSMVASIAFATPLSFSEIPLIPLRMWTLFLGFIGIKKRTRRWGVVYDSVTKQPLDPAYVTLKNLEGQTISTTITDIDGRYGFSVNPGVYTLSVNKTNYTFPSIKLAGRQADELYDSLYLGDMITVSNPTDIIAKNIPLDPISFSWNETEKEKKGLTTSFNQKDLIISKIFNFLFILGFLIALIALIVAPQPYNGIIFSLYLVVFVIKKVGLMTKNKGSVIEKATGLPLQNGIIRLFYTDIGQEIAHAIIDKSGKFYCLVQNGTYKVQIEKKNLDGSYTPVYQQSLVTVTNGVLNMGFRV